ncbi:hypothetical protein GCM10023148_37130 [Actinokineospora soli]
MSDLNRRALLSISAGVAATAVAAPAAASPMATAVAGPAAASPTATPVPAPSPASPFPVAAPASADGAGSPDRAEQSWRKLAAGNERFVSGRQKHPHESLRWREKLVEGQKPFAAVLGCGDSRVPPELVFDEGLGDLFTVRAAGEVLDGSVVGSLEYAVEHLHVPLVVILGHESCGAVKAAIDLVNGTGHFTGDVSLLVRAIEPAVRATPADPDKARFLAACVAEQTRRTATLLVERSTIIREALQHGVKVVPASYELRTGRVTRLG